MNAKDKSINNASQKAVLALMKDGKWHSATEIIEVSNQREGLRRMRQLRSNGWDIAKRTLFQGSREFEYRITNPPTEQP